MPLLPPSAVVSTRRVASAVSATVEEVEGTVVKADASVDEVVVVVMATGRGNPNASIGPLEADDDKEEVEASDRFRSLWEGCNGRFFCKPRRKRGRLMGGG
jgi:hypothetical protein